MDWKHTRMGDSGNSVPDSCCLYESPGCGRNLFSMSDLRNIVEKINIHGCFFVLRRRLEDHVYALLLIFIALGGFLSLLQLVRYQSSHPRSVDKTAALCSVLVACCLALRLAGERADQEEEYTVRPRPGSPAQSVEWRTTESKCL